MARKTLDELLAEFERPIRAAFIAAIEDLKSRAEVGRIIALLEQGDIEGAIRALHLDPAAFRGLDEAIARAYGGGGDAAGVPRLADPMGGSLIFRFDVRNPRAEAWLRTYSGTEITRIVEDQREAVRTVLVEGMTQGTNPRTVALDIVGRVSRVTGKREGGILGLTSAQERASAKALAELSSGEEASLRAFLRRSRRDKRFDRTIAKAIREGKPIDKATIERMVGRYRDNLLKLRADTIARTEALTSLQQAKREAFEQAIETGAVARQDVRKVWNSAGDGRVRHTHRALDNGESVAFDAAFVSPSGARMMHPGDTSLGAGPEETIQCRCDCTYRIDYFRNIR